MSTVPSESVTGSTTSPDSTLEAKLRRARTDLLDLTLRNNMLNFRMPKRQGLSLDPQSVDEIFSRLVRQGDTLRFATKADLPEGGSNTDMRESEQSRDVAVSVDGQPHKTHEETNETHAKKNFVLTAPYTLDQLQSRLLQTFRTARSYIEEQGANTLFLALGFLEWYEADASDKALLSPLALVPVQLERDAVRDQYTLKSTDEDIVENLSLKYRMKLDFGLDLPDLETEDVDKLCLSDYIAAVKVRLVNQQRWTVHVDKLVLGFFSFGKYLMFHDLDPELWPETANPLSHEILTALLGEGFHEVPSAIGNNDRLDDVLALEDMRTVLDADSSQLTAVVDVSRGRNLIIQGPPGTGKSQTIANAIARAVLDDKKVLFVAEKMAALEVVKNRLERIGLGAACLELHSNKTNKRHFLLDLDRTWQLRGESPADVDVEELEYRMQRKKLNEYTEAVHSTIGTSGVTPYQAMGTLVMFQEQAVQEAWPLFEVDTAWSHEELVQHRALLSDLQALVSELGVPECHPFWGCQIVDQLSGFDKETLLQELDHAVTAVSRLQDAWLEAVSELSLPLDDAWGDVKVTLAGLTRLANAPNVIETDVAAKAWQKQAETLSDMAKRMRRIQELHAEHAELLLPDTWTKDLSTIRGHLIAHQSSMFRFLSSEFKAARTQALTCLRHAHKQSVAESLKWMEDVIEAQQTLQSVMSDSDLLRMLLGSLWRAEDTDWATCADTVDWVIELHKDLVNGSVQEWVLKLLKEPGIQERAAKSREQVLTSLEHARSATDTVAARLQFPLEHAATTLTGREEAFGSSVTGALHKLQNWQSEIDRLSGIILWNLYAARCRQAGLSSVPKLVSSWSKAGENLVRAFTFRWYQALLQEVFKDHPNLAEFSGNAQWNTVERFRVLDEEMTRETQRLAVRAHLRRMPPREASGGELGVLRREMQKKARHMPIRKLLEQAGHAIQGLKPVFMASPLSVSTFLPPGSLHFDLVVFDEASQVLPVDAFGALLRGRQLVVVGDSKQLPPTNFFDVSLEDDDSEETELRTSDMESILGLCASQGMPERMLRWHYRSRHESLVAVSNAEFYDGRLVVFPSPRRTKDATGLVLHHLDNTAYDRGKSRTNRLEARAVAEAVMFHAKAYTIGQTNDTLGVVAFSSAQADAIEDEVDRLRRQYPESEGFFAQSNEKFFVKNLETVQGDERDVIFISVGYGRDADGYLTMSFGPLGKTGGERRLNVLITRARVRCEVFTNLRADDIDLHRAKGEGIRVFKEFLKYCESGVLDMPQGTGREMDSPFEEAVRDELTRLGYQIDVQVGSAGFFIDLAVVDWDTPGRYLLGIECDGRAYHSSRSARDRDRLRQQVLEGLGWKLHRIWSTDWFRDKRKALEKVVTAIENAKQAALETEVSSKADQVEASDSVEKEDGSSNKSTNEQKSTAELVTESSELRVTVPYAMSDLEINGHILELHEVPLATMADWIRLVVAQEGPVHMDVVVRRIAEACGVKRVGRRIRSTYESAVRSAVRKGYVEQRNGFLYRVAQGHIPLRDRADLPVAEKRISWIADEEVAGVLLALIDNAYGYAPDELISDACRSLGFQRVTQEMREAVARVVEKLCQEGCIQLEGVNYVKVPEGR